MAELYDANDELNYDIRINAVPGGIVIEDTETDDAVIEVARNYVGDNYDEHYDPVYLRAENEQNNSVVIALNVEAATKLRDALNAIVTLYT